MPLIGGLASALGPKLESPVTEITMTAAEERSAKWAAELNEIDEMTPEQLRAEVEKLAEEETFLGAIAGLALAADQLKR